MSLFPCFDEKFQLLNLLENTLNINKQLSIHMEVICVRGSVIIAYLNNIHLYVNFQDKIFDFFKKNNSNRAFRLYVAFSIVYCLLDYRSVVCLCVNLLLPHTLFEAKYFTYFYINFTIYNLFLKVQILIFKFAVLLHVLVAFYILSNCTNVVMSLCINALLVELMLSMEHMTTIYTMKKFITICVP